MIRRTPFFRAGAAAILLSTCTAGSAAVLDFTGSMTGLGAAGPSLSCAPLPIHGTVSASTTSGSSSLGAFTYSHDICFNPVGGPFQGTFTVNFGADSFNGTLLGADTPTSIPKVFDLQWAYTILGGTGRFFDASGNFTGTGIIDSRVFPAPLALSFGGNINAPAVPEPDTWAMMLVGFGGIAMAMRRKRRRNPALMQIA